MMNSAGVLSVDKELHYTTKMKYFKVNIVRPVMGLVASWFSRKKAG